VDSTVFARSSLEVNSDNSPARLTSAASNLAVNCSSRSVIACRASSEPGLEVMFSTRARCRVMAPRKIPLPLPLVEDVGARVVARSSRRTAADSKERDNGSNRGRQSAQSWSKGKRGTRARVQVALLIPAGETSVVHHSPRDTGDNTGPRREMSQAERRAM
jgi:hypothetical protein